MYNVKNNNNNDLNIQITTLSKSKGRSVTIFEYHSDNEVSVSYCLIDRILRLAQDYNALA